MSSNRGGAFVRYTVVSVVSTVAGLGLLGALVWTDSMSAAWANIVTTIVTTLPCVELYRRWVWDRSDQSAYRRQLSWVVALSAVGLALSTVAAAAAGEYSAASAWSAQGRVVAVEIAANAVFAALWLVQFVVLERGAFRVQSPREVHP